MELLIKPKDQEKEFSNFQANKLQAQMSLFLRRESLIDQSAIIL